VPFFGPAIDDRSGAGREGRPRTLSLAAASLLLGGYLLALLAGGGAVEEGPRMLAAVGGVGLLGFAVALLDGDPTERLAAYVLLGPAGVAAAEGLFALSNVYSPTLTPGSPSGVHLAVVLLASSIVAAGSAWGGVTGTDSIQAAVRATASTFVVVLGIAMAAPVIGTLAGGTWSIALSASGSAAIPTLLVLTAGSAFGPWLALRTLPIAALAPRNRREAVVATVAGYRRVLLVGGLAAGASGVLLGVVLAAYGGLPGPAVLWGILAAVAGWPPLGAAVVIVGWTGVAIATVAGAVRRLARMPVDRAVRWAGPVLAAVTMLLLVASTVVYALPPGAGVGLTFAFLGVVGIVQFVLLVLTGWFLLLLVVLFLASIPSAQAAAAVMAAGPTLAAVVLGATRGPPWLVLLGVTVTLPIWLLVRHATALTGEVGWRPHGRRVQRAIVGWTGGAGLAVFGTSVVLYVAVAGLTTVRATAVGATAGVALLCLWLLRE
jgi:hypothetical protein